MAPPFLRSAFRRLPQVARRDDRIAELQARLKKLERDLARNAEREERSYETPSFRRNIYAERRTQDHLRELGPADRGYLFSHKLENYSFARSHGLDVPTIFGVWDRAEEVTWDELPDSVVVKSVTGASGRGVVPLRRRSGRWSKVTTTEPIEPPEIVERFHRFEAAGRIAGPYFAEELLAGKEDNSLPVDVKVHAFYGEISHVLLRNVARHGTNQANTFRVILPDGTDAGPVLRGLVHDHDIPVPGNLDALMAAAARVSFGVPRAFIRVDMYDVDGRIVFGELTPRPGHLMDYGPEQDERIGHIWERAQARMLDDALGRPENSLRFGSGPRELMIGDHPYLPDGAATQ